MTEQLTMRFAEEVEQIGSCDQCRKSFPLDELEDTNIGHVCVHCLDEYFFLCERCNQQTHHSNHKSVKENYSRRPYYIEQSWCPDCVDQYASQCHHCSRYASENHVARDHSISLCRPCYENYYCACEECGEFVRFDDSYSTDSNTYCEHCYSKHGAIKDYGYRFDNMRFHNGEHSKEKLYLGVELEVECGAASPSDIGQELIEEFDETEYLFCLKEDGSLDNGFEVVSQPCDLAYHQTKFGWKSIIEFLKSQGCTSHNPGTCGLHIHLSKGAIPESAQVKLTHFVNSQVELMETLARRSNNSYAKIVETKLKRGQNHNYSDRYEAVNFKGYDTVELRLFRGTLRHETFIATLELAHALVRFAQYTSAMTILKRRKAKQEFLRFVQSRKKRYSNLVEYLKHRGVI